MPQGHLAGHPAHWRRFGEGPREALLIHCSLAHAGVWRGLAAHLSDVVSCTGFDLPGHGRSGPWVGPGDIQDVSTRMAAALLPEEGRVDLVGHSFGATVALRLALSHPARIRSLTLIEPVFFAVAFRDVPECKAGFQAEHAGFEQAMSRGELEAAARAFTGIWGGATAWEDIPPAQQTLRASQMPLIQAAEGALHDDAGGLLQPGQIDALDVPSLLIEGAQSPRVIAIIQDGLERRLPDVTRARIVGAGHMLPITHPAEVAAPVRALFARS
ncbi:alpha/beta fold hydrolase [Primorskyibacter sp. S187A]|uniref:alpha/beta fold hydrolase n=1 Tax=Primorskyibacter sp. S187A TaxID=3415130 RepID=UPI003C7A5242